MSKFKVGEKVKCVDASGCSFLAREHEYVLTDVNDPFVDAVWDNGKTGRMFASRFELVEQPWRPKVGDRVRYSGKSTIYSEPELIGITGIVTDVGIDLAAVNWDVAVVNGIRTGGQKYITNLEPTPVAAEAQPAALKIEAGRFYKTRDGRKVLVKVNGSDSTYPWFHDMGYGGYHAVDGRGRSCIDCDEDDLIAEWVDEPTARQPAISNDNAEPAKQKFKVGDRVNYTLMKDAWQGITIKKVTTRAGESVYWADDPEHGEGAFYDGQLELSQVFAPAPAIVALIENGTAKPATKPKVHADQASATAEAERLALEHPGQQFGVFVLADSKIADIVQVPTPVLRAA